MATKLAITEYQDALVVTSTHAPALKERLMLLFGACGILGIVWFMFQDAIWIVPIAAILIAVSGFSALRRTRVELRMTETEIVSEGRITGSLLSRRSTSVKDLLSFTYVPETESAEGNGEPSGLYAKVRTQHPGNAPPATASDRIKQALQALSSFEVASASIDICLLPYLNEAQALTVIDRIAIKFPSLSALHPARQADTSAH